MANPIVTFEMENGDIMKAELYPEIAPNTVNNFISLVKKGFYDGLIFHRVINGFMIQGGCPDGTGMGGPGYQIKGEFSQNGVKNDLLQRVCCLWRELCIRIQQVPSSLSCIRTHRILTDSMQHLVRLLKVWILWIRLQQYRQISEIVRFRNRK